MSVALIGWGRLRSGEIGGLGYLIIQIQPQKESQRLHHDGDG